MITAGGQHRPSPGIDSAPPRDDGRAKLSIFGHLYYLPERVTVKVNTRAQVAWFRRDGVISTLTPDGFETITPDEHAALLEGWDLLP